MKKIIIVFAVILVVVLAYNFLSGNESGTTADGEIPYKGFSLRKSFKEILPGDEKAPETTGHHEEGDNVVVIKSEAHQMDVEDAEDRIEALKDMKDNESVDFARWTLFSENSKYTPEEKEKLLDKAIEVLSAEDKRMLLHDVIFIGNERSLHDKVLATIAQDLNKEQLEAFVTEVVRRKPAPPGKAAVIEFAATRNIYVK